MLIAIPIPPSSPAGMRSDSQPDSGATIMLVSGHGAMHAPTIAALNPNSWVSRNGVDNSKVIDAMNAVYAPIADSASTGRESRSIGRIGFASLRSRRTK